MDDINQTISVNEKLKSFMDMTLREAYKEKAELIENTKKEIRKTVEEKEIKLLEDAYHAIQTGTRQNRRELNEAISKTVVDGKRRMFDKRRDIIKDVFRQVKSDLEKFKRSTEYPLVIVKDLLESIKIIGKDEYIIEINSGEVELLKKISGEIGIAAKISESQEDIIGGFIIYGKNRRIRIDCSFKTKTQEARGYFLEMCTLPMVDGDLMNDE